VRTGELEDLNGNELVESWQQLQSLTQEETRDCGDAACGERLDQVNIVGQALSRENRENLRASDCPDGYGEQRTKGHIFICQLALVLRRVLELLPKLSGAEMTSRRPLRQVKLARIVRRPS